MSTQVGGPMFEPSKTKFWEASQCFRCRNRKDGAHYNIFSSSEADALDALRVMFPDGEANEMNFVLFSTSGVHGTYSTIEDAERAIAGEPDEDGEIDSAPSVTFLIVHPRIVCLRYGNCAPRTAEDIAFLKQLRASSIRAVAEIGMPS